MDADSLHVHHARAPPHVSRIALLTRMVKTAEDPRASARQLRLEALHVVATTACHHRELVGPSRDPADQEKLNKSFLALCIRPLVRVLEGGQGEAA